MTNTDFLVWITRYATEHPDLDKLPVSNAALESDTSLEIVLQFASSYKVLTFHKNEAALNLTALRPSD